MAPSENPTTPMAVDDDCTWDRSPENSGMEWTSFSRGVASRRHLGQPISVKCRGHFAERLGQVSAIALIQDQHLGGEELLRVFYGGN